MNLSVINAVDGFAMAMVVILILSFGVVALLVVGIYRCGKRSDREVETLLEELRLEEAAEKHPAPSGSGEERAPWEREQDWWKR